MAGLANLLEDFRNWRGRQEWQAGKENDEFSGGNPDLTQFLDEVYSNAPVGGFGLAGVFAGVKSKTANKDLLVKARKAINDGLSKEQAWSKFGWGSAPWDKMPRYEIPDNVASLRHPQAFPMPESSPIETGGVPVEALRGRAYMDYLDKRSAQAAEHNRINPDNQFLSDVLDHPALYEAYPQLKGIQIKLEENPSRRGSFDSLGNRIYLNKNSNAEEARSNLLHEVQHAIQEQEGFYPGGSMVLSGGSSPEKAYQDYLRLGGEAEARLVQKRADYKIPRQRELLYPWSSGQVDVPIEQISTMRTTPEEQFNALSPSPRTQGRMGVIEDWLKDVLGNGGMSPQELWDRGRMVGFTEPEVHAARLNLLGTNRPDGNGGYIVELPSGLSGMTR